MKTLPGLGRAAYRRSTDIVRPYSAFVLSPPDGDGRFQAFPRRRSVHVAAMLGHAAWEAAKADLGEWRTRDWAERFVAGHGDMMPGFGGGSNRFSYIPLPSVGGEHADGMVRRALVAEQPDGDGRSAEWARLRLTGDTLCREEDGSATAALSAIDAENDPVLGRFTQSSKVWSTVTPVILPGYDGGNAGKLDKLLHACLRQAGYGDEMVESMEKWRDKDGGMYVHPEKWYANPRQPRWPAWHVRIRFRAEVAGPVAMGRGRHVGLGVFATC